VLKPGRQALLPPRGYLRFRPAINRSVAIRKIRQAPDLRSSIATASPNVRLAREFAADANPFP
jgi:hypothetical protein